MNNLERLLKLLAALLDTTVPLSAEDLRRRIGGYPDKDASFRRKFERDKDDLRQMGVNVRVAPVPTTDPPVDGYLVDQDEYAGQDPGLLTDELAALYLAFSLVRDEQLSSDTLWKLGGRPDSEPTSTSPVQLGVSDQTAVAGALEGAISERRQARFSYRGVDRVLEPSRLSFTKGHWYVSGFDQSREADRVFRLDRIDGSIDLGDPGAFEQRSARGPQVTRNWELGDEEPVDAVVQIEAQMVAGARIQLEDHEVEEQADGSIIATVNVRNSAMFRDWVLSFYDNAVVLGPPAMREMMTDWFTQMVDR